MWRRIWKNLQNILGTKQGPSKQSISSEAEDGARAGQSKIGLGRGATCRMSTLEGNLSILHVENTEGHRACWFEHLQGFCIWGLHLSNLPKSSKRGIQRFCIWSLQFGQLDKWVSKLGKNAKLWTTLQTRSREQSHARGKRAPGDLLFLSFAKSKCQFPWRWPIFILCILLWEFANSNKCQVNLPKPLEMLANNAAHIQGNNLRYMITVWESHVFRILYNSFYFTDS